MSKYIFICMALFISFEALANKSESLSQKLLKPVIQIKCDQEISASAIWKGAAFFMNEKQQQENKKAICQCVSEHAMDDMNAQDLLKASFNEAEKDKLVNKAIKNSVKGCVQQVLK